MSETYDSDNSNADNRNLINESPNTFNISNTSGGRSVFSKSDKEYGIKEIIDLLKHIPSDQDAVFGAEMIKRTLASMKISITDILDDAKNKETAGQERIQALESEIKEYLSRVERLKHEISDLNEELQLIAHATNSLTVNDQALQRHYGQVDPPQPAAQQPATQQQHMSTALEERETGIAPESTQAPRPALSPDVDTTSISSGARSQAQASSEAEQGQEESILFANAIEDTPVPTVTEAVSAEPDSDIDSVFEDDDVEPSKTKTEERSQIIFDKPITQ